MKIHYSNDYVLSDHSFDTTRKSKWVATSLVKDPMKNVSLGEGFLPLLRLEIEEVHFGFYVEAVKTGEPRELAESQGFKWDGNLFKMAAATNGGMLDAALLALCGRCVAGTLSSGLHHARRDRGRGFCTFNGLAIAALRALKVGAERVLILDLDAHHGGGTHSILKGHEQIEHLDIATCPFDYFSPATNERSILVTDSKKYITTIKKSLDQTKGKFDLCLYNAGVDPEERCAVGGLKGITADTIDERETIVFEWCKSNNIPVAFALAGGYVGENLNKDELVDLHRLTIFAASSY
jgi:acetoin utilization deacetylase AcuC-like enzyme